MRRGNSAAGGSELQWAAWMRAAQAGDSVAYECLLGSLLAPLRGFVRNRGVDDGGAEDVVQEILILLHRARHTWRPERPFEPWLWAIARNAATDALRRQGRERRQRDDGLEHGLDQLAADPASIELDPELRLLTAQLAPDLVEALRELPAAQREAIELLYIQQLDVAEAAQRAGVTQGALKVRAHRGSRALRDALGERGRP